MFPSLPIDSRMAEIAKLTDVITIVLVSIVIVTNIVAIILLLLMHNQTKRATHTSERYKTYKNTIATVVSVTKVAYYIKRYEKPEPTNNDVSKKKSDELLPSSGGKKNASVVEKYSNDEIIFRSPDSIKDHAEVKKYRYKVLYEFTPDGTENLYTGECYVYHPETVKPGDIIEITYKPDDPMINFTDYSLPSGISSHY